MVEPQVIEAGSGRYKGGGSLRDPSRTPTARVFPLMSRPGHAASRVVDKGKRIGSLGLPVSPHRSRKNQTATCGQSANEESQIAFTPQKKSHKREGSVVISSEELPLEECGVEVGFDGDTEDSEDTEVAMDAVSLDAVSLGAHSLDQAPIESITITSSSELDSSDVTMKSG